MIVRLEDLIKILPEMIYYLESFNPDVVNYALRIPVNYKLHDGIEKWILRQAMIGSLPDNVLWQRKTKFGEGSGVGDLLAQYAEDHVSEADFQCERHLPNGWIINSKEESIYYRIFRQHFGELGKLAWIGRAKGVLPMS